MPDGLQWVLVVANYSLRRDNGYGRISQIVARQMGLDLVGVSDQQDLHVVVLQRFGRALDCLLGAVVAAHGVEGDPHRGTFLSLRVGHKEGVLTNLLGPTVYRGPGDVM